ncbi:uroporphyrinogen-III synthase, partial [candidate division TA06 bacterium]|nr:uroporphyrinogen-III synthase [candidate division TA06 bacterium]
AGQRILLPRADLARKGLARALEAKGALVEEVTIYRTLPNSSVEKKIQEALQGGEIDWITFTSASAVRNFADLMRGEDVVGQSQVTHYPYSKNIKVACIGPITEKACKEEGIPVQTVAKEHTIEGLVDEMVKWLNG